MSEIIFVLLLNEGVDVWKPINARKVGDFTYEILEQNPEDEEWEFQPGDIVVCKEKIFSGNTKGLVAYKRVE